MAEVVREWKEVDDERMTNDATFLSFKSLRRPTMTFWTLYQGEFYECEITLPPFPPNQKPKEPKPV